MPKKSPDQIHRHEIVLGRAEREMVRNTLESLQFKNYSTPVVAGLSDVTFTLTISALLGLGIGAILDRSGIDPDWRTIIADMTPEQIKDWFETQNLVGGGIGAIAGALLGGPFGAILGGVAGSATVEGLEYAEEQTREAGSDFFAYLGQLHNRIEEWAGIESNRSPGDVY
tara:strand:+ start:1331 stop:1840 length:510 start_codon:yes stop_codon:yes gene_type:complete